MTVGSLRQFQGLLAPVLAALLLAGCGADGKPTAPTPDPKTEPGVHISGSAQAGVKARF